MTLPLPLFAPSPDLVPALSLWQPFASLVAMGLKPIETRLHRTHVRGPFVVCATQKVAPPALYEDVLSRLVAAGIDPEPYRIGNCPRGVANLTDCRTMTRADEPGAWVDWTTEAGYVRWAWVLAPKPERVQRVAVKGGQGWFRLDRSILVPEAE